MKKLLMLQGLPASGKTTEAKLMTDYFRVNKDDLRDMLFGSNWNYNKEELVLDIRDLIIDYLLKKGKNVVSDDTNFNYKNCESRLIKLAVDNDAEYSKKLLNTPLYECINRDDWRNKHVGAKVIIDMYNKYLYKPKEFKIDKEKEQCIIIDIDGTLAHRCDRGIFEYNKVKNDVANINLIEIIKSIPVKKIIVSGRDDNSKEVTEKWLKDNGIEYDEFYMRVTGDNRCDTIVKKEIYENNIKDRYEVLSVFDDRPKVIRMWKELGLFVMDCNTEDPRIDF